VVLLSRVAGGVAAGMVGLILDAPLPSIDINLLNESKSSAFVGGDEPDRTDPSRQPVHDHKET
jgi:hypothetical protein